jgi:hypothetical protein
MRQGRKPRPQLHIVKCATPAETRLYERVRQLSHTLISVIRADWDGPAFDPGGYLLVSERGPDTATRDPRQIIKIPVGFMPEDKVDTYWRMADWKVKMLHLNIPEGHVSSYQSRDRKTRFGGAILTKHYIFCFSGIPELLDEAYVLVLAVLVDELTEAEALRIAAISGSTKYFTAALEKMRAYDLAA